MLSFSLAFSLLLVVRILFLPSHCRILSQFLFHSLSIFVLRFSFHSLTPFHLLSPSPTLFFFSSSPYSLCTMYTKQFMACAIDLHPSFAYNSSGTCKYCNWKMFHSFNSNWLHFIMPIHRFECHIKRFSIFACILLLVGSLHPKKSASSGYDNHLQCTQKC